jgi:hypothetical protein
MSQFQQPAAGGDQVKIPELLGSLVLVYVREVRENITTPYGEKEAIACDLHTLDGPKGGEVFENSLIFQGALIGSLRSAAGGDPVLARIGQGVAKPGQSAPYILQPFTDADAAIATAYIAKMAKPFQPPAAAAPANPAATAGPTLAAAASPSPAAASPATANGAAVDYTTLPPEVQELLKQSGAMPR